MSIKIELIFDNLTDAITELRRLADTFTLVKGVDTGRHLSDTPVTVSGDTGLPPEAMVAGIEPVDRKPARRASRKTEAETPEPTEVPSIEQVSEAPETVTPPEPPETAPAVAGKDDVERLVTAIMVKFHEGDGDMKLKIREWRDSMGLTRLSDMKPEHVPTAQAFLATL